MCKICTKIPGERNSDFMWRILYRYNFGALNNLFLLRKEKNIMQKPNTLDEVLCNCPHNQTLVDNIIRAWAKINSPKYEKIVCTISGGSDSDDMLDIVWRCDKDNKVDYVWIDTGLEYQATKEHLQYLEEKYNIKIKRYRAIKPIPLACRTYGQPFLSKQVSEFIQRLQKHNFQWKDKSFKELQEEYPNCQSALKWWCNANKSDKFNIRNNKYLKEFLIENPPTFNISNKCCLYAKKNILHQLLKEGSYGLNIFGVRKAEGGTRSTAYKSCFNENDSGCDSYRPLFWYKDSDKRDYENAYDVKHSACYREYGLKRTGCAGCPFGRAFEQELEIISKYEPKLYQAVNYIFKDSYEYTKMYWEFRNKEEMVQVA